MTDLIIFLVYVGLHLVVFLGYKVYQAIRSVVDEDYDFDD